MLDTITNYFASLSPGLLYFALFVSSFVENVFPPVPGDTVTLFAAYLAGRSTGHIAGVFVSTTLGSLGGFMIYYGLGRLIPLDYFIKKNFRFIPASQFVTAERWFQRYGYWIILANRFLSGLRSVISIVCGMYRLPWLRVVIVASIGASIWNGLLIYAGFTVGENWRSIDSLLQRYSRIWLLAAIVLVCAWLLKKKLFPSSRKSTSGK
jgi:membrane protein DedA with SNARE-associated domain